MMDGIGAAETDDVARVEHADTVILFFTLMKEEFTVSAEAEKEIAAKAVGGADVVGVEVDAMLVRGELADGLVLVNVDKGNGDGADARVLDFGKSLGDDIGGAEGGVVVDRKKEWRIAQSRAAIALDDQTEGGFGAIETNLGKFGADHLAGAIGGSVVDDQDARGCVLGQGGYDRGAQLRFAILGSNEDGGGGRRGSRHVFPPAIQRFACTADSAVRTNRTALCCPEGVRLYDA